MHKSKNHSMLDLRVHASQVQTLTSMTLVISAAMASDDNDDVEMQDEDTGSSNDETLPSSAAPSPATAPAAAAAPAVPMAAPRLLPQPVPKTWGPQPVTPPKARGPVTVAPRVRTGQHIFAGLQLPIGMDPRSLGLILANVDLIDFAFF